MSKTRLFLASCVAAALAVFPMAAPAAAQEEPQFDCVFAWYDFLAAEPIGWSIWDLVVIGEETTTVRGDLALDYAGRLTSRWATMTADYVDCVRAYAEAVAADSGADAEDLLACVTATAAPLLASDPITSRYVEPGPLGVVYIHHANAVDDAFGVAICAGLLSP